MKKGSAHLLLILSVLSVHSVGQPSDPITNSIGIQLVSIQPGTFTMGQDGPPMEDYLRQKRFGEMHKDFDRADFDEKPAHRVTISQGFQIGVTEITVAQFRQFDPNFKTNDPKLKPADDDAASGVTWERAVAFCEWLSKKEGKTYRLPTEAEWEFACRAGTTTRFHAMPGFASGTNDDSQVTSIAWFAPNSLGQTRPVGQRASNGFGLHDMSGNVAEWVSDWIGAYPATAQTDPTGPASGTRRVLRGGYRDSSSSDVRSSLRNSHLPSTSGTDIGFRVVRNP